VSASPALRLEAVRKDAVVDDDELIVYADMKDLHTLRQNLIAAGMTVRDAELNYVASTTVPITDDETEDKLFRLLDTIDDLDDVTNVYHNAEIS